MHNNFLQLIVPTDESLCPASVRCGLGGSNRLRLRLMFTDVMVTTTEGGGLRGCTRALTAGEDTPISVHDGELPGFGALVSRARRVKPEVQGK